MFRLKDLNIVGSRAELASLPEGKLLINTINAHSYNTARKDQLFAEALTNGDVLIPDGVSIVKACRWIKAKSQPKERIAGWDLFAFEMEHLEKLGMRSDELGVRNDELGVRSDKLGIRFGGRLIERDLETGYEAYLITDLPLLEAKRIAVQIEDTHPLGRLFDIDIIDKDGVPVSRDRVGSSPRRCLVCDREARYCMRMRWHTQEEIWERINAMVDEYQANI